MNVSLVRYWNYIVSPLLVILAFFATYVIATLDTVQRVQHQNIVQQIRNFKKGIAR